MTRLGVVDTDGKVRFSGDQQAAREFLEQHGLEVTPQGWRGFGRAGTLCFDGLHPIKGSVWSAAYWSAR